MSDEHASREPTRDENGWMARKPRYEAPAIVELTTPATAAGQCMNGSGEWWCELGSGAAGYCTGGSGF